MKADSSNGLRLAALAMLAGADVIRGLKAEGKLNASHYWVALKGARKYVAAVASGDIALPQVQDARLQKCRGCDALTVVAIPMEAQPGFCGSPVEERMTGPVSQRFCGCLCVGKAAVASEKCPRGKW